MRNSKRRRKQFTAFGDLATAAAAVAAGNCHPIVLRDVNEGNDIDDEHDDYYDKDNDDEEEDDDEDDDEEHDDDEDDEEGEDGDSLR